MVTETFILVVVQDAKGYSVHFTKTIVDNFEVSFASYKEKAYEMVKDWLDVGFEIKVIALIEREFGFGIKHIY